MTIYPELQQRLVAAAAAEPVRRSRRQGAAVATVLLVIASVFAASTWPAGNARDTSSSGLPAVPAGTLAKAVTYADVAPDASERTQQLDEAALSRISRDLLNALPYPPARQDDALVALSSKLARARDMSQITVAGDLRAMSEYRAACAWQQFWVAAHAAGDRAAQNAATAVLDAVPRWPSSSDATQGFADAARRGDAAVLERQVQINCGSVGGQAPRNQRRTP